MKFSVVIPTYNRASELRETLHSLAGVRTAGGWELIVVDNNSNDQTRKVVEEAQSNFPVELRYLFEKEPGRCAAMNAGIGIARGEIIVNTDDDVRVAADWLDQAAAGLQDLKCDYVGGKVLPIWGGPKPDWLSDSGGRHWSVIALLNYGPEPVEFGVRYAPLGVNLAFHRSCFERAGLWDNRVGRKAGTLLGQEVREWCMRARAAGLRGFYVPGMVVHHVIPGDRLNKAYFRRWFYWHGISRALLYKQQGLDMTSPEETSLDYTKVPHIAGVPRFMYRQFLNSGGQMLKNAVSGKPVASFENELYLWFFAGVLKQRWKDRKLPVGRRPGSPG
jgi:glycosyltransferase involved in cell wall biosynthesis